MARTRNTGMQYSEDKTKLLNVGEAPILLEPVSAVIKLNRKTKIEVYVLDHIGNRTGEIDSC
jgi:hypothetical protein